MRLRIQALTAALLCCLSCVEVDDRLGANTVPEDEAFRVFTTTIPINDIYLRKADSLSGFSASRMTFGAIRDDVFGVTRRGAAFTLVPMYDSLDFGVSPIIRQFRFSAAADSVSLLNISDAHILQNVKVYELSEAVDPLTGYDCNSRIRHSDQKITKGTPVINGTDSLVFEFTTEYARKFLELGQDKSLMRDFDSFVKKFPGIYIETADPAGNGGRINMFNLQLGYDSNYKNLTGNLAKLTINSYYPDEMVRKDTTFFFYFGANDFYSIDSLLTNSSQGKFPEYCLNVTSSDRSDEYVGRATDKIIIEGGGGVKPVIDAKGLRAQINEKIKRILIENGIDSSKTRQTIINKASLILPFEFPDNYRIMYRYPQILSPSLRSWSDKTRIDKESGDTVTYRIRAFACLTDSSSKTEDTGAINRNPDILAYRPDVTYYVQSLLTDSKTKDIESGDFDIWMLLQAQEVYTTTNSAANDLSEYYQYLAYQSYYNNMYGSSGNDYYSNYYTYMMAAMYAGQSATSTNVSTQIDKERYYNATLNGPESYEQGLRVPELRFIFSVPAALPK